MELGGGKVKDGALFNALDMKGILSKHLYLQLEFGEGFQDALVNGVVRRSQDRREFVVHELEAALEVDVACPAMPSEEFQRHEYQAGYQSNTQ